MADVSGSNHVSNTDATGLIARDMQGIEFGIECFPLKTACKWFAGVDKILQTNNVPIPLRFLMQQLQVDKLLYTARDK